MRRKLILLFSPVSVLTGLFISALFAQGLAIAQSNLSSRQAHYWVKPAPAADFERTKKLMSTDPSKTLPLWTFFTEASRDDNGYSGVMVGQDPFNGGGSTSVPTYIIPLKIVTNTIATGFNSKTGVITSKPGVTLFDPTVADKACLTAPNDVPLILFQDSPIFESVTHRFGGTDVGNTQYVDAFQRANFWQVDDHDHYHVLLDPIKTLAPVVVNVPANKGFAIASSLYGPPPACGIGGQIDIDWFDSYLDANVLPALVSKGVTPSTFPIFLLHNVVWGSPTNVLDCCTIGYHATTGFPIQTYSPVDFDDTATFPPAFQDSATLSHEVAEWVNDPFGDNPTPPWGHIGQVSGCQDNLEVGDPLSGTQAPPEITCNGFTYHLQELAFFSWFFGSRSIGIHGWFSNNGTFLHDAGPPCQ